MSPVHAHCLDYGQLGGDHLRTCIGGHLEPCGNSFPEQAPSSAAGWPLESVPRGELLQAHVCVNTDGETHVTESRNSHPSVASLRHVHYLDKVETGGQRS